MDHDKYPTIFHIDIDAFFASVEEAINPALRGKSVVVGGLAGDRGVVACPNYEARKLGVKTAMSLSNAVRLAPNSIFLRGNYRAYEDYSKRFIQILDYFSPVVKPASLDEAYLDADGCIHFWNYDPYIMATAIKKAVFNELKITVSIGVSSNRICAKVASDQSKKVARVEMERRNQTGPPDGLIVVPLGKEKEFLAPLPASAIPGVGMRTAAALDSLNITTVDQLANADIGLLKRVLGTFGIHLHNTANGFGSRLIDENERETKSISRSTTFAEDSGDEGFISSMLFLLSEKIGRRLRRTGSAASTVTIKMRYSNGAPLLGYRNGSTGTDRRFMTYQMGRTLDKPTNSEFEIASTAFDLFKKIWLAGTKVRYVGVGVCNITTLELQTDLFDRTRMRQLDLLQSIDKIKDRFGNRAVYFGVTGGLGTGAQGEHSRFGLHI